MKEFLRELTIEDLPGKDMKMVAEYCGMDIAVKLIEEMPSMAIYIPKSSVNQLAQDYIRKNYNGSNVKKLAVKTGYSEKQVYRILHEGKKVNKPRNGDIEIIQIEMFDNDNGDSEDEN